MSHPRVSFVVPCYRLANLLGECLQSILAQTYSDFEILVMDDCSPDNTREVVASFSDPRVKYVRNDPNLGHLKNYNKGIELSRGEFVWLISADDLLSSPMVLERYMEVLEKQPEIGYAFCPAIIRMGDNRTGIAKYTYHGEQNAILDGREFLSKTLLKDNGIAAASGLVRKTCYKNISVFPLDMPYAGDWYLWSLFALYCDVAYFAEPMVEYRIHEMAITAALSQENVRKCVNDDLVLHWRIRKHAADLHLQEIAAMCLQQTALQFGRYLAGVSIRGTTATITVAEMNSRLAETYANDLERKRVASQALARAGDLLFWRSEYDRSWQMYRQALRLRFIWPSMWMRSFIASDNFAGTACRKAFLGARSWRRLETKST